MLIIIYVILLVLVVAALFIWGRKISWLSSKITFIGLLVFLAVMSLLLIKVIYKVNSAPKVAENAVSLIEQKNSQEALLKDTENYKKKTTIIIGTTANFHPWIYQSKKTVAGFNADLLKKAVNLMAKKVEFKIYSNKVALFNALDNREIDVIANLIPVYNKDNNKYSYSLKITNPPFVFIAKKSFTKLLAENKSLQDLSSAIQNKTIVMANSTFLTDYVAKLIGENGKITTLNSHDNVVISVEKGKYEVGFTEYFSFLQYLKAHPKSNIRAFHPLISNHLNGGLAFVVSSKDVELKKQLDIALSLLKRRGAISNLSIKYFKEDITL